MEKLRPGKRSLQRSRSSPGLLTSASHRETQVGEGANVGLTAWERPGCCLDRRPLRPSFCPVRGGTSQGGLAGSWFLCRQVLTPTPVPQPPWASATLWPLDSSPPWMLP